MGRTRAELREQLRWRLHSHADSSLVTSDATMFDLNDLLMKGVVKYAQVAKAYPVHYERASISGIGEYHYGYFGAQAADTDLVSESADAANTTAFTIAASPAQLSAVTVILTNGNVGASTGNAATYTIVGYGRGYVPITEILTFVVLADLIAIAAGASVTKTSRNKFLSVTSITPFAAQPANWTHTAGVAAETPGLRVFELWHVEYNDLPILRASVHDLDRMMNTWRTAASGTPNYWVPWAAQTVRLWRAPSGTSDIAFDGWEVPDAATFADDAAEMDCHEADTDVAVLWACILATVKYPNDENMLRQSPFWAEYQTACVSAYRRIHNAGDGSVVLGKYSGTPASSGMTFEPTITNIP